MPSAELAICLFAALLLRFPAFGNYSLGNDDNYYHLVGTLMHRGAIPYVDIWDRKPPGLFLIFYIFSMFGPSVTAYSIGATLTVGLTAFLICRLSKGLVGNQGALLSAASYIASCTALGGIGGQAELFCNLLVTAAYFLVIKNLDRLRGGDIGAACWAMLSIVSRLP